jgi:YesN/AraC family two-component response regulator
MAVARKNGDGALMYRAMVVDDEKWTLMGICRTFSWEAHGFAPPEKQTDPEAALTSLLASPPDVAFVDIRMPAMTGLELIAAARGRGVASEFVILSGLQDFEYARTAMQYAVFDYLLKPLHADAADRLLARLKSHLDGLDRSPRAAAALSQVHARLVNAAAPSGEGDAADAFSQLVNYVEANLSSPLLLKDVAARFYLTPNYVSALFRQRLDTTFSAHLNRLRVQKAQTLLRGTKMTVEEIALSCGYADAQYFSRVFRQATGETPMQYRKGEM